MDTNLGIRDEQRVGGAAGEPGGEKERAATETREALRRAAEQAVVAGATLDGFMAGAYAAYLQANPDVREQIESMHLMAHLNELRRRGFVGAA